MTPRLLLSFIVSCLLLEVTSLPGNGQIVPDMTLPNQSDVRLNGNTFVINGGTTAGKNLFHSFSEFSVSTGTEAFFNNSLTIDNIITRVTGGQISNIDGLIRANGTANLFLINPNGIVFGNNASLDIGGSFFSSSAESIQFADCSIFSATEPTATPLLTISVPIGLQLGQNPGAIRVQGTGHNLIAPDRFSLINQDTSNSGLRVSSGNTLALVGGEVTLEGSTLTAAGGRIELGSVNQGLVRLTPPSGTIDRWTLGYEGVQNFGDIQLLSQALVDVSGVSSGSIQLQGEHIQLRDGSVIWNQNQGVQAAGSISVNASESLEMSGASRNGQISNSLISDTVGVVKGRDIEVSTQHLAIQDGGLIITRVFSGAPGGNITVNASKSVQLIGFSRFNPSITTTIGATTFSDGKAGDVKISTGQLTLRAGGSITSATFGSGSGGKLTVQASDSIEVIGVVPNLFQPSLLSATTLNEGDAGSLEINTSRLVVRDGGRIDSSTLATGSAGSITIDASESVEVSGTAPGSVSPSVVISSANIVDPTLRDVLLLAPLPLTGSSGEVTINTGVLWVTDGGLVSVRHDGEGDARRLQVNANSIVLDRGAIAASSFLGTGGDIELQVRDALILRNNSEISTRAGTQDMGGGDGGNITIYAAVLALLEQSNINANAFEGNGGNIRIIIEGLFVSPDSSITASSELGIDGVVTINTPDVDPSSGLLGLPTELTDPSNQIIAGCPADKGNVFVITGQGGLPANPTQPLQNQLAWQDWRFLFNQESSSPPIVSLEEQTMVEQKHSHSRVANQQPSIIEATGWIIDESGGVELVAQMPDYSTDGSWYQPVQCGEF